MSAAMRVLCEIAKVEGNEEGRNIHHREFEPHLAPTDRAQLRVLLQQLENLGFIGRGQDNVNLTPDGRAVAQTWSAGIMCYQNDHLVGVGRLTVFITAREEEQDGGYEVVVTYLLEQPKQVEVKATIINMPPESTEARAAGIVVDQTFAGRQALDFAKNTIRSWQYDHHLKHKDFSTYKECNLQPVKNWKQHLFEKRRLGLTNQTLRSLQQFVSNEELRQFLTTLENVRPYYFRDIRGDAE